MSAPEILISTGSLKCVLAAKFDKWFAYTGRQHTRENALVPGYASLGNDDPHTTSEHRGTKSAVAFEALASGFYCVAEKSVSGYDAILLATA